jgi:hypothetical protein
VTSVFERKASCYSEKDNQELCAIVPCVFKKSLSLRLFVFCISQLCGVVIVVGVVAYLLFGPEFDIVLL